MTRAVQGGSCGCKRGQKERVRVHREWDAAEWKQEGVHDDAGPRGGCPVVRGNRGQVSPRPKEHGRDRGVEKEPFATEIGKIL